MSKKRSKARRQGKPAPQAVAPRVQGAVETAVVGVAETGDVADIVEVIDSGEPVATLDVAEGVETIDTGAHVDAVAAAPVDGDADREAAAATATAPEHAEPRMGRDEPSIAMDAPAPDATPATADPHADAARFAPFDDPDAIRGVLIQVAGGRLLLPNATIAEVLSYAEPDPVGGDAPAWLLGRMRWRGWQLPLVAFSQLAGVGTERAGLGTKVVVLKAIGGQGKTPYFAILTQGFPRLVTVSQDALARQDDDGTLPRGIQARVRLNQDEALLPDLASIEHLIVDALAQAA